MKILRNLSNMLAERKNIGDDKLSIEEVKKSIGIVLPKDTQINMKYSSCGYNKKIKGISPKEISKFIEEEFVPTKGYYCEVNCQTFYGRGYSKHYLDFIEGREGTSVGIEKLRREPFKKVTLDYILKN